MRIDPTPEFRIWLQESMGFSPRSSADVASRVRRASRWVDLSSAVGSEEIRYQLICCPEFVALTPAVKAQLRRAANLYVQFRFLSE
jgi:hypothetical protein